LDGPTGQARQRTLTPAVLASVVFVAASALFAITFVAGRGGLEMPVASRGAVAAGSAGPITGESPRPSVVATVAPATAGPSPTAVPATPTAAPTPESTIDPTEPPATPAPTTAPPSLAPDDPLLALPECPGQPGCFIYVIQRNDTLSGVVSRYLLSTTVVLALNPQVTDPRVIVTGTTLYLGRDPYVRLEPCSHQPNCFRYVVVAGDSLGRIAARYGLTIERIQRRNPGLTLPLQAGQVIKLPRPRTG